ncbi:hypothetical protein B0H17DRAFT_1327388 [Mycena rosella]|uniref:dual-specificity kinase n=1 Tax=Mycena rosella TaxID=1033263 RepID=A0AAD7DYW1_MYCRO|nr:hypothetical protein B0H17DRAFT_1327388 [Mycena rosella]
MASSDGAHPAPVSLSRPRRDRPPALDISEQSQEGSERDVARQPSLLVTPTGDGDALEPEYPPPRSTSATSSLDPYYFGLSDSPVPPLPTGSIHLSTTPDQLHTNDPVTPARDPALIDRRGLVGVGHKHPRPGPLGESFEEMGPEEDRPDAPDSPWTIEAVDGEMSEREELPDVNPTRTLRERPSMTEESGGEEILYPRKLNNGPVPDVPPPWDPSDDPSPSVVPSAPDAEAPHIPPPLDLSLSGVQAASPPSAFAQPRRAKKRTSDEFEMDQSGTLVSKRIGSSKDKDKGTKDDKTPWEGIGAMEPGRRASGTSRDSAISKERVLVGLALASEGTVESSDLIGSAISSDEQPFSPSTASEKTPKKGTASARSSFTPKRGSTSSTTYASTPTTSSRDSASMSVTTTATSISAASSRHSLGKARRNSAGSDASSVHSSDATSLKDRVASLAANGDAPEETVVPPVPPLPKDLSAYRSPPPTSTGLSFPLIPNPDEDRKRRSHESEQERMVSLEVPSPAYGTPPPPSAAAAPVGSSDARRRSQHYSGYTNQASTAPESAPAVLKTPSKKWSFSNALNLRLSSSPSSASASSPKSPRSVTFGQQLRKSTSKDKTLSPAPPNNPWEQPAAMSSAASLASLSSVGSVRSPGLRPTSSSKTPDRGPVASRTGTDSSASTNHTTSALSPPQPGPLSPTSSVRRNQSKRLTPSSIPFFRRSSSQSMQIPATLPVPSSPTQSTGYASLSQSRSKPDGDYNPVSTSTPGKKSSVLSLLKGSTSRRSLHADSKEAARELQKAKDAEKEKEKLAKAEKEKQKKDDKDRSESRISVLMGRKRGKTLSSTEPPSRKTKSPVHLPPIQMSALEPATAQRVARLKSTSSTNSTPSSTPSSTTRTVSASRLTSQTVSSMQKQSDSSLRTRNQLPTIAGSPSVGTTGTNGVQGPKETKEPPPSSLTNSVSGMPKETPTKIPRISSRTSTVGSPMQKGAFNSRRASVNVGGLSSSTNPSPTGMSANEFGVMENDDGPKTVSGPARNTSVRGSPSTVSTTSRVPRQSTATTASSSSSVLTRKPNRDSISFTGLRKSSTSSVASASTAAATESSTSHHRFSALSPSRGLKLLSPKIGLSSARVSNSTSTQSIQQVANSPSSSRQSLSTPSPVPSSVDDEEAQGDEEMMHYIRRQQAKKMAAGASQEELDELLCFPEPLPPGTPSTPAAILKSSQNQFLSEFERKEILDFPSVYYIGARSKKKAAVLDNSANNYGYDDDRGDYLVVNHDHLAFRYEIIDTLGKGSFGQVLHCRDHCTGESVAVKMIRNKKRFHHQAIVEIKILDNLRKWDPEEKHHVIKMTEHFYFRNHLCIAMELLSINLYELIKANGFVGFTTALIRRFANQMLLSLSLMRHHRIVHCDLKPENVLLRHPAKSALTVIDFGSSCLEHEKKSILPVPEVILGMNYHMAIDMWSLGCILAELYIGFPIFPGENEQEQLSCIMEVLGIPDKEFVNRSSRRNSFSVYPNGAPRAVINSKGRRRRPGTKTLAQVLRCNDEEFVDFISKCLVWDPERRIKPQAAMRHPFVTAGKRPKPPAPTTPKATLSSSTLGSSRVKQVLETPKKSLISAPTPLTARTSRTTGNGAPTTPSNSAQPATLGSSRSYRTAQNQGLSTYHSSRTLNGIATTAGK